MQTTSSEIDLTRAIRGAYRERGWEAFRDGKARLRTVDLDESGAISITGEVQDKDDLSYKQDVRLVPDAGGSTQVSGTCTCRTMVNCAHVAALIYAWTSRQGTDEPQEAFESNLEPEDEELSGDLAQYLDVLEQTAAKPPRAHAQAGAEATLRYDLALERADDGAVRPVVRPLKVALDKDGQPAGKPEAYALENVYQRPRPGFLTADDIAVLETLAGSSGHGLEDGDQVDLRGPFAAWALERMLATGRAYWADSPSAGPLRRGPARPGQPAWHKDREGRRKFGVMPQTSLSDMAAMVLPLSTPFYLDPQAAVCGPIDVDMPGELASVLLAGPPVPREQAGAFATAVTNRLGEVLPTLPSGGNERLSEGLIRQLDALEQAAPSQPRQQRREIESKRTQLRYYLALEQGKSGQVAVVKPATVSWDEAGTESAAKGYSVRNVYNQPRASFLSADDVGVLETLAGASGSALGHETQVELRGPFAAWALERMLATGRTYWAARPQAGPLARGEPAAGTPAWITGERGSQRFTVLPDAPQTTLLPLSTPYYVDLQARRAGPVALDPEQPVAGELVAALLAGPPVPAGEARPFRQALESRVGPALPAMPAAPERQETRTVTPTPILRLTQARIHPLPSPRGWRASPPPEVVDAAIAELHFDYGGARIVEGDPAATLEWLEAEKLVRVPRADVIERQTVERLSQAGLEEVRPEGRSRRAARQGPIWRGLLKEHAYDDKDAWLAFCYTALSELQSAGWRVEIDHDFPYEVLPAPNDWTFEVTEEDDGKAFSVRFGVEIDGDHLDLRPHLASIVQQLDKRQEAQEQTAPQPADKTSAVEPEREPRPLFVPLGDGRHLPLPTGKIEPVARTLEELVEAGEGEVAHGGPRIPAARLGELSALETAADGAGLTLDGGRRLRALAEALRTGTGLGDVPIPKGLRGTLRDYQHDGYAWLQTLAHHGFGGILADDMGLGKTIQALAHVLAEKEQGRLDRPALLVAPTSVVHNWVNEAQRFAPDLRVLVLHGPNRSERFPEIARHDLVVTTYALLPRDRQALSAQGYHVLLCDEAQNVKNADAQAARVLRELDAHQAICLTGTPMENHLDELWSLMRVGVPGVFADRKTFRKTFRTPIEKRNDQRRRAILSRRVRPFLLRRTKLQVASELPPRTEMREPVELTDEQVRLYEQVRQQMDQKVRQEIREKGLARSQITVLDALLKLRQVCCDPRLVKLDAAREVKSSAKLQRLMGMLEDLIDEGRQVLVFSQFTSMLSLIAEQLDDAGIDYVTLTGATRDRQTPVEMFQDGEVPIFLISLKAGGTGLNLTAADTVIHYDPWWNPAVEAQASDRAHRIGQDKPVFVYKMIAEGTVEERIVDMQARKRDLASLVQSAEQGKGPAFTEDDLEELLSPVQG
ncbi:hypothetical protein CKO28_08675 [Rhodovibrio sodomensis]|uniref:Helicase SNF2 n=1 Tax=Rhodovibrio sodomensis TaxID=1088 RepID=A0ABS1DCE7_9PROT|nr:SNF2-related protein [Rhodovibrio sodomensis]MBK1668109.1 hypothetical protein [Rhodovibrio sodomensis]